MTVAPVTPASDRISVVMVSYRTGPALFGAIAACLAAPDVAELIVVNHDNPPEVVQRLDAIAATEPRVTLIHTGANLGFSKGCNIGARAATGAHLLFLNPDTVIPPGAAARMALIGEALPEPWVVGARILNTDGSEQRGGRRGELTLLSAMAGFIGLARFIPGLSDIHRESEPVPSLAVPMPAVSGAGMMLSRAGFDALGGFDEGYFLHVEDLDLCKRARLAGGVVMFEPRAELIHHGSTSHAPLFKVEWLKAKGLHRYFMKFTHGPQKLAAWALTPLILAAIMGRAALLIARGWVSPARDSAPESMPRDPVEDCERGPVR